MYTVFAFIIKCTYIRLVLICSGIVRTKFSQVLRSSAALGSLAMMKSHDPFVDWLKNTQYSPFSRNLVEMLELTSKRYHINVIRTGPVFTKLFRSRIKIRLKFQIE